MEHEVIAEVRKVLEGMRGFVQVAVDGQRVVESDNFIAATTRPTKTGGVKVVDVFVQPEDWGSLLQMVHALAVGLGEFLGERAKPGRLDEARSATVSTFVRGLYEAASQGGTN